MHLILFLLHSSLHCPPLFSKAHSSKLERTDTVEPSCLRDVAGLLPEAKAAASASSCLPSGRQEAMPAPGPALLPEPGFGVPAS